MASYDTRPLLVLGLWSFISGALAMLFEFVMRAPPDHRATLALDHLNRVDVATIHSPNALRFKAFHDRALTHLGWCGDGFEPTLRTI